MFEKEGCLKASLSRGRSAVTCVTVSVFRSRHVTHLETIVLKYCSQFDHGKTLLYQSAEVVTNLMTMLNVRVFHNSRTKGYRASKRMGYFTSKVATARFFVQPEAFRSPLGPMKGKKLSMFGSYTERD